MKPSERSISRRLSRAAGNADLLEFLTDLLSQQRGAIMSGNLILANRLYETLSGVLAELPDALEMGRNLASPADFKLRLRTVRSQIAVNQRLLNNGMAISDHFVRSIAETDPSLANPLFSGVA